ncbi:MAG TPA: hypothetical protein H9765_14245 [Candidatus Mediterraneibacter intestinigallinarum]|nr:hypothetical protein [Candidatus Mediterraneibacter intestinigallinarum]
MKRDNSLLRFFLGVILLGAGLFLFSQRVIVRSGWYVWRVGTFAMPSGLVVVPLIIGVIWYFCNPKSVISKIIMSLGVVFIVLTVIMSISISFMATSLFDYILILLLIAAGCGLLLRTLFKRRDE